MVFAAVLIAAVVLYDAFGSVKTAERSGVAMGSIVTVKLYGTEDTAVADEIIERTENEEKEFISRYKEDSEIYFLNKNGTAELSGHTADIINRAIEISADSGGAFDITIGKISSLWNFDGNMRVPDEKEIEEALPGVGSGKIKREGNVFTLGENQELDLGALGKGLACDIAAEILKKNNIGGAVVSVGGSVMTYGENPESDHWTVGIRTPDPLDTSVALRLRVYGTSFISTSGDYEKYFYTFDTLFHHILSPKTGYPADSGLKSVTVVSGSGLLSDALSTACFVLGMENSANILEKYNAEAIFIDNDNNVYITDRIFDSCTAETGDYTLMRYGK